MGIKGSNTTEVYFDNTKVPVENLIGSRLNFFLTLIHQQLSSLLKGLQRKARDLRLQ